MSTTSTPIDPYKVPYKGELLDPYKIADLFQITDPVIFQALKKILRFGRKHKPLASDVREAITSLERWEALQKEKVPVNLGEYGPKPNKTPGRCPHCDGLVADKIHDGPFCFCDPSGPFFVGSRVHITWKDKSYDWNEYTILGFQPGGLRGRLIKLRGEIQDGIKHDGKPFEVPLSEMEDVQPSSAIKPNYLAE